MRALRLLLCYFALASCALAQSTSFDPNYGNTGGGGGGTGIANLTNYATGRYYRPIGVDSGGTGTVGTLNKITCLPGAIGQKATVSAVASYVSTSATGNDQWGIYASNAGTPGALIAAGGQASTASTGMNQSVLTTPTQFGPGSANGSAVWFCEQVSSITPILYSAQAGTSGVPSGAAYNGQAATNTISQSAAIACTTTGCAGGSPTFGTMPATLAGSTWADLGTSGVPAPYLVFSSVP